MAVLSMPVLEKSPLLITVIMPSPLRWQVPGELAVLAVTHQSYPKV